MKEMFLDLSDYVIMAAILLLVVMMIHYWHRSNVLEDLVEENEQTIIELSTDISCLEEENNKLHKQCMHYEDIMRRTKVTSCVFEKQVKE